MRRSSCYLCMLSDWKDQKPVFSGYRCFSSPPWQLSNTGQIITILYETEAGSFGDALRDMEERVKRMAEMTPGSFWKTVWEAIDPSEDAYMARYKP